MPWKCEPCGVESVDDTLACPACGVAKTSWTVHPDVTRALKIAAPKLQCLRTPRDRDGTLTLRIEVDPNDPASADDRFLLFSKSGDFAEQLKTIADDLTPDDDTTDLRFEGLDRRLSYSLEVDPGSDGDPYLIVDDIPFAELVEGVEIPELTWAPTKAVSVTDKGTLRDLAQRGIAPDPSRLLRLRRKGGGEGPAQITAVFATREEAAHDVPGEDGQADVLFAYGPGTLDGITFAGVTVIDLNEETESGHVSQVEVRWGRGRARELEVESPPGARLRLVLSVDPNDEAAADDQFILTSPRGAFAPQLRTIRDDLTPGDDTTELLFTGLDPEGSYTLEIDPGGQDVSYRLFEDVPYAELLQTEDAHGGN